MRIHKEGHTIIFVNFLIWAVIAGLCFIFCKNAVVNWVVVGVSLFMSLFMMWFFRVPFVMPLSTILVISPEMVRWSTAKRLRKMNISVKMPLYLNFSLPFSMFMFPVPVGGVKHYKYHPGKYIFAFHPKSSEKNERTTIAICTDSGNELMFRQIAGIVARRVVCYAKENEYFGQNAEAGFIKFGSRLDVFLPLGTEIFVKKGDKVSGQTSVLAKF